MPIDLNNISINDYKHIITDMRNASSLTNPFHIVLINGTERVAINFECNNNYKITSYNKNETTVNFTNYNYVKKKICSLKEIFAAFIERPDQAEDSFEIAKTTVIFYFSEAARSKVISKYCEKHLNNSGSFLPCFNPLVNTFGHTITFRDGKTHKYNLPLAPFDYYHYFNSQDFTGDKKEKIGDLDRACAEANMNRYDR